MEKLLKMLEESQKLGDIEYYFNQNELNIDLNDFEGFDNDYNEIDRDFVNEDLVNQILDFIENNAILIEDNLYKTYQLNDNKIIIGCASFD